MTGYFPASAYAILETNNGETPRLCLKCGPWTDYADECGPWTDYADGGRSSH